MEGPGVISKLSDEVVNRIAAGEIIQRPANALKELLENSLDACASNIVVTVKAGGLKYLQITDNGTGIRRDNLDIVCERFTTSKLKDYEDLRSISTYGFRGEALASISHIAHLSIMTKTSSDKCAYKASYENGKLNGPIKACAGNNGTQITVEDLFYNVIARKKALRSASEEYTHIMEVVGSYAIHNSHIAFTLKKFGENTDIKTPVKSSVIENVRIIHGNPIARELLEIEYKDATLKLALKGYITNVNYSNKKGTTLLFINHRLVDSQSIRKAVDTVYSTYLPKNAHPFVYLSLELDPRNIDVNVHPTKHEVHFLYEEQIIEKIKFCVENKLIGCNSTRMMYTQALLPGAMAVDEVVKKFAEGAKVYANNKVRVDAHAQKIEKFFKAATKDTEQPKETEKTEDDNKQDDNNEQENAIDQEMASVDNPTSSVVGNDSILVENDGSNDNNDVAGSSHAHVGGNQANASYVDPKESFKTRKFSYCRFETKLTSIKQLRLDIENNCNMNLREVLANLIFIGCIDIHKSLIQHSTQLYLCDTTKLAEELFYETLLYDFQNYGTIKLSNPLPVEELVVLGLLSKTCSWDSDLGDMREMANNMTSLLIEKKEMLFEYFSLEISDDGHLVALPLLLDGHTPFMGALPNYIIRLVTEVNWESEKECFDTFSRQTAKFYSRPNTDPSVETVDAELWRQEHVIFPAIRKYFLPPNSFTNNAAILKIASLTELYKVFERC